MELKDKNIDLPTDQRRILRHQLRQRRRALSQQQQQQAAALVCQRLLQCPILKKAQHIGLYLPFDGEVETQPLCQALWQRKKQLYLPTLNREQPGHLLFLPYTPDTPLQLNQFGLQEPRLLHSSDHALAPPLQVIVVPLVAFDQQCHRLGMGGGYYDRTLKSCPEPLPYTIGAAHDCQQIAAVPKEAWDFPLSAIMTPTQWLPHQRSAVRNQKPENDGC